VRVSKVGDKVILEPFEEPSIDFDKFWAELDALGAGDFLPDGVPDEPFQILLKQSATSLRRPLLTLSASTGITELGEP
jgi:hypothetical protein